MACLQHFTDKELEAQEAEAGPGQHGPLSPGAVTRLGEGARQQRKRHTCDFVLFTFNKPILFVNHTASCPCQNHRRPN